MLRQDDEWSYAEIFDKIKIQRAAFSLKMAAPIAGISVADSAKLW
jgi:hypothetical protein